MMEQQQQQQQQQPHAAAFNVQDDGDGGNNDSVPNPLLGASWISRLLFLWVDPLFKLRGKNLSQSDLFSMTPEDRTSTLSARLTSAWNAEISAHPDAPSLGRAYIAAFGMDYVLRSVPLVLKAVFMLLQTVFLGWLLDEFRAPVYSPTAAYCWALAMVLCVVGSGLCHHTYFFAAWRCGMQWRAASLSLLFAKSTRLRLDALSSVSAGHVVNLAASDVERFQKGGQFYAYLVLAPCEAAAALGLLYIQVGWQAMLAGTGVLLLFVGAQARFSQLFGRLRAATATITDERVRLTGQVISGIRVLKTLAWEAPFNASVAAVRKREIAEVNRTSWIRGANEGFFTVALVVVAAVTFYTFWAIGGVLTPSIVFTSSLLLIILQMEMGKFFPSAIESVSEIRVSLRRMQAFLLLPELTAVRGLDAAEQKSAESRAPGRSTSCAAPPSAAISTTAAAVAAAAGVMNEVAAGSDSAGTASSPRAPPAGTAAIVISHLTCYWAPVSSHAAAAATSSQRHIAAVRHDARHDARQLRAPRSLFTSRGADASAAGTLPLDATASSPLSVRPGRFRSLFVSSRRVLGGSMTTAPAAAAASSRVSSAAHHVLSSGSDNDSSSGSGVNSSAPASGSMSDRKRVLKAPASRRAALVDVSFTVAPGSLTCLVGPVGCGKSSLLMAVLGELPAAGGVAGVAPTTSTSGVAAPATLTPSVACSIAYVSQTPFLLTGSIRDNITFGLPFDEAKYAAAVEACAMVPDLAGFADGSDTVIGERGVNLSGGQRARVGLARALYQEADVYLLDDPLSAVDTRVGRHIFNKCICGPVMRGKARLLVTHQLQYLRAADSIVVMSGGRVLCEGTFGQLAVAASAAAAAAGVTPITRMISAGGGAKSRSRGSSAVSTTSSADGQSAPGAPSSSTAAAALQATSLRSTAGSGTAATVLDAAARSTSANGSISSPLQQHQQQLGDEYASIPPLVLPPEAGVALAEALSEVLELDDDDDDEEAEGVDVGGEAEGASGPTSTSDGVANGISDSSPLPPGQPQQRDSPVVVAPTPTSTSVGDGSTLQSRSLIQVERMGGGSGQWLRYFAMAGGPWVYLYLMVLLFGGTTLFTLASVWLAKWSNLPPAQQSDGTMLSVYGVLVALSLAVGCWRAIAFFLCAVEASRALHDTAFARVLRAPVLFFDSNPSGRVLNRFSKDVGVMDDSLPWTLFDFAHCVAQVLGSVVLVSVVNPWVILAVVPLFLAFMRLRKYYMLTARPVKALESIARSPVYSQLTEVLSGLPVIRAYGLRGLLSRRFEAAVDGNTRAYFAFIVTNRWLGIRLDGICISFLAVTTFACVAARSSLTLLTPGLIGLSLSQLVSLTGTFQWAVRQSAELENQMVAVERVLEYADLSPIEDVDIDLQPVQPQLPQKQDKQSQQQQQLQQQQRGVNIYSAPAIIDVAAVAVDVSDHESSPTVIKHASARDCCSASASASTPSSSSASNLSLLLKAAPSTAKQLQLEIGSSNLKSTAETPSPSGLSNFNLKASPPPSWPSHGAISFDDVYMRYRADLAPALSGVSLSIPGGWKCGIVGRSGAGKSSFLLALLRLVEPDRRGHQQSSTVAAAAEVAVSSSKEARASAAVTADVAVAVAATTIDKPAPQLYCGISIDGVDTAAVHLSRLRRSVMSVPQDPVLYSGSLRYNLDPFNEHDDDALHSALRRVQMDAYVTAHGGLSHPVSEGGSNLSVGQRQLLCLARAILRQNRILLMDEATANVKLHTLACTLLFSPCSDLDTDAAIRSAVETTFADATVITVAHRIATVISCDSVLVMDAGHAVQWGHPHVLLQDAEGVFARLVRETGAPTAAALAREAETAFTKHQEQRLRSLKQ